VVTLKNLKNHQLYATAVTIKNVSTGGSKGEGGRKGHAPLATWASAQTALKVAIFRLKIETFSGEEPV